MNEITPLLKQKCDVSCYNATSEKEGDVEKEEEPTVYTAECEIPLAKIVISRFSGWRHNGANIDIGGSDITAMNIQYRRVTGGREVLHNPDVIINELAGAMLRYTQLTHFYICQFQTIQFKNNFVRNLRENWSKIITFDENLALNPNPYYPPTCRERFQNYWMNCIRKLTALPSNFIFQLAFVIVFLGWPLSLLVMGFMFVTQCPMNSFLPKAAMAVGLAGIAALLLRLVLAVIEKWYWFRWRRVISSLWNALKVLEFGFLLALTIQLWFFFGSPTFHSKDPNFCNETFYTYMFLMKYISTAFAVVLLVAYFVKAVFWLMRVRYNYMPLFDELS